MKVVYIASLALVLCAPAQAIDSELYQKYQAYKERQQTAQGQELEQARAAVRSGDLETAQKHLDIARNLAYAPDAISALEQEIATEKNRREQERLAREQQERLAQQQREEVARAALAREEQERLAQQQREEAARAAAARETYTYSYTPRYGLDSGRFVYQNPYLTDSEVNDGIRDALGHAVELMNQ